MALFLGCAWVHPRQINPLGQCSPVGRAQSSVPISHRLYQRTNPSRSHIRIFSRSPRRERKNKQLSAQVALPHYSSYSLRQTVEAAAHSVDSTASQIRIASRRILFQPQGCSPDRAISQSNHSPSVTRSRFAGPDTRTSTNFSASQSRNRFFHS